MVILKPKSQRTKKHESNLTIDDVKHISKLANLSLTDGELEKFRIQLASVLGYVSQLQKLDTSGIEETAQVTGLTNVFRADESKDFLTQEQALSNSKHSQKGFFEIPGIFEQS